MRYRVELSHFAGDLVPTKVNEELFVKGDTSSLVGDSLNELVEKADISSVNLECPLSTSDTPIDNCGPNLRALPETIEGIKALNTTVVKKNQKEDANVWKEK